MPVGVVVSQRGHRRHRDRRLLGEATAPLIVDAHDAVARVLRSKQQGLRLEVVLHVAVVVEVVVLQVCESRNVKDDSVDAVQRESVSGQLNDPRTAVVFLGGCQEAGDDGCLSGRAYGLERNRADVRFHGAASDTRSWSYRSCR